VCSSDLGQCQAVCFGSLGQRVAEARSSIQRFLQEARRAVRLFDVNLRQDFYNQHILRRSCELATAVKLNEQELPIVASELGLYLTESTDAADSGDHHDQLIAKLMRKFDLRLVALTRGERGTTLFTGEGKIEGETVSYDPVDGADAVGAGDACSAGLLVGMVRRWPWDRTLSLANHMGAFVASQKGATPCLPDEIIHMVK